jgi:hypothetical protein
MEKLDDLVAGHIEVRLLQPERLEEILSSVLDRRHERTERCHEHIAELNKCAAEADVRLKRLYDAIENGVADLDDPALKERVAGLKAIRDQAHAEAEHGRAMLAGAGNKAIPPSMVHTFAATARERMRTGGGYRRDHIRALAQRVEVADGEVRIMGSRRDLLRTLKPSRAENPPRPWFAVLFRSGVPYEIRTRVTAVKGRCPGPLDERDRPSQPTFPSGRRWVADTPPTVKHRRPPVVRQSHHRPRRSMA